MQAEIIEGYRLSPQQKHLWLIQQHDVAPLVSQCVVRIEGNLDRQVLREALSQVVQRHEILRTAFRYLREMSTPLQVITDAHISWGPDYELNNLGSKEKDERVRSLLQDERERHFDLEHSLLHVNVISCSLSEHILLLTLPALCADATGLENLVKDLSGCYAACLRDEKLTDEPLQYADLSELLNELLESEETETGRRYWRNQDHPSLRNVPLPFEHLPSSESTFAPQAVTLELDSDFSGKLDVFIQQQQISMQVFLLACWQLLLHRFTGESEITVATAFDGRTIAGVEEAIGLFTKFIPVTVNFKVTDCFSQVTKYLQETIEEIGEWQDYFSPTGTTQPFAFAFHTLPADTYSGNVRFQLLRMWTCAERSPVRLSCTQSHEAVHFELSFDSQRHRPEQMQRLAQAYCQLLQSVVSGSD